VIDLDDIAAGLDGGEFFLEYLPTISLDEGRCVGAEALIRWRRPTGVVPPNEFIPLAENTPLSGLITYWVIETAAAELGDWLRAHPDVHLGINVPPEILGRGGLEYAGRKSGLKNLARQLVLEVTERGVPDKLGAEALGAASRHGIRVALDDVDVSGANMIVLSRCHVEVIKLDKTLIEQIGAGEPPEWLTTLSALLRTSNLEVIAEGVESAEQCEALRGAGIKMGQGYYFSRPLSVERFKEFFDVRRGGIVPRPR
jgi:EAL domain-containing protein (putative c-di-GMP-specific phosphodiesterase class I)